LFIAYYTPTLKFFAFEILVKFRYDIISYDSVDSDKKKLKINLSKTPHHLVAKIIFPLLESLRMSHPNPLMTKETSFRFDKSLIKWKNLF